MVGIGTMAALSIVFSYLGLRRPRAEATPMIPEPVPVQVQVQPLPSFG